MTQPDLSHLMPVTLHLSRDLMAAALRVAQRAGTSLPAFIEETVRERIDVPALDVTAVDEVEAFCALAEGDPDELPRRFRTAYDRISGTVWERYWNLPRMSYEQLEARPISQWPRPTLNRAAVRRDWRKLFEELAEGATGIDEVDI